MSNRVIIAAVLMFVILMPFIWAEESETSMIIFGGDYKYPPFEFLDESGIPTGFNIDLINAIAREKGISIGIRLDVWYKTLSELQNGNIDVITGMLYSSDRVDKFYFSRPHSYINGAIIVRKSDTEINSLTDLSDKDIIVQHSDIMHEYAIKQGFADHIFTVDTPEFALSLLATGHHDAVLLSDIQARYIIKKNNFDNLRIVREGLHSFDYCFASKNENRRMIAVLNEGLLAVKESGEYQELYDKWFTPYLQEPITLSIVFRYILIALVPIIFVFIVFIFWTLSLKSQVKARSSQLINELGSHKETLQLLRDSRNRYQQVVDSLPEMIFEIDCKGKILFTNKNVETVFGYNLVEAINKVYLVDLVVEKKEIFRYLEEISRDKNSISIELTGIRKDKSRIPLRIYASVDSVSGNRISGLIVDITLEKRAELIQHTMFLISESINTTRKMQDLYERIHIIIKSVMPVTNLCLALYDKDKNILSFPYNVSEFDDTPQDRELGDSLTDFVIKEQRATLLKSSEIEQLVRENKVTISGKMCKVWLGIPLKIKNEIVGVLIVQDFENENAFGDNEKQILNFVSEQIALAIERKETEYDNYLQRIYFEQLFNNIPAGVVMLDEENNIISSNKHFTDIFAYTQEELLHKNIDAVIVSEEYSSEAELLSGKTHKGEVVVKESVRRSKYGKEMNVLIFGVPILVENRQVGIYGIYLDVSPLFEANRSLFMEKEKLSVMLSSIGEGVIATDVSGKVVLINHTASILSGWDENEAIGQPIEKVFSIISEVSRTDSESLVKKVVTTGKVVYLSNSTILLSKDGKEKIIEDSAAPIKDNNGNLSGVIVVFRDVTEKKKIEEELQKNAKLESVGILAGGIAHDFNNILTAIMGNISLAQSSSIDPKIIKWLVEAERASIKAKNLTQQLLTFSKGGTPVKKTAAVPEILYESAKFSTHGSNVSCRFNIAEDISNIEADADQVCQVISNLVINAVQAMPLGGNVTISASNTIVKDKELGLLSAGRYVLITVEDNGGGIDKITQKRIFDPFYTTKKSGSGLGLTTSYNIIKQHNGLINLESDIGKGTKFYIYLPATESKLEQHKEVPESVELGKGTILVLDDDEVLIEVVSEMLDCLGYKCITTRDGKETIETYSRLFAAKVDIDAVLLDLTIPGGMGGKDTVKEILAINPDAVCIVSSGYSDDPVIANFKTYGFQAILNKPYSMIQLGSVLKKILGANDRTAQQEE